MIYEISYMKKKFLTGKDKWNEVMIYIKTNVLLEM